MDSGDLLFAPCDNDDWIRESDSTPMPIEYHQLCPVEVKLNHHYPEWRLGVVIQAKESWAEENSAPYYIKLVDDGKYNSQVLPFYGPKKCIRKAELRFQIGDRVDCQSGENGDWRSGIVLNSNHDWGERGCPPYFIQFDTDGQEFFWGSNDRIRASTAPAPDSLAENRDDSLFEAPPAMPDCPVCFLPLPIEDESYDISPCCGQLICSGCRYAMGLSSQRRCPYCRALPATEDQVIALVRKRVELNDAENTFCLGCSYYYGYNGLSKDKHKAFELFLRAADLGSPRACTNAGTEYLSGTVTEKDLERSKFYLEKGAKLGQVKSRHQLLAFRHWKISASLGLRFSLDRFHDGYKQGMLRKEEYETVLRASYKAKAETWSKEREVAVQLDHHRKFCEEYLPRVPLHLQDALLRDYTLYNMKYS